jgi:hypothetical protein
MNMYVCIYTYITRSKNLASNNTNLIQNSHERNKLTTQEDNTTSNLKLDILWVDENQV